MQSVVSLLEQTWARLVASLNIESLSTAGGALPAALSDGPLLESIGVGFAVFVAVMLLSKLTSRSRRDEADQLRERLREFELKLEAARGEVATAKRVQQDLQKGDPRVFASALATAIAENGPKARDTDPEVWLEPLRPALAEAYLRLARDVLGKAKAEDDLKRARTLAQGAVAAEPERKECAELLARIDEAERVGLFNAMSEADALAWRIARKEAEALDDSESRGLVTRSRGQIGYSILLSGWESEDLHAAAVAELSDNDLSGVFDAEVATEAARAAREPAARREDSAAATTTIEGARVVSLSNGANPATARDGDTIEEAQPMRAVGAAGGGTVVVMSRGRGGAGRDVSGRASDTMGGHGSGDGGGDERARAQDTTEREAEFRRLWERRRRPDMLGETHPRTLAARANMGYEAARQSRHADAEEIFREVIAAMGRAEAAGETPGDHRIEALSVQHNLAMALLRQGKLDDAEEEFRSILSELGAPKGRERSIPLALAAAHGLGEVWSARGDHAEAEKAFGAVWRARSADEAFGPDHPHTLWSRVRMLREAAAGQGAAAG